MMAGVTRILCIIPLPSKFCLRKFDEIFGSKHSVLQRYVDQVYLFFKEINTCLVILSNSNDTKILNAFSSFNIK